MIVVFFPFNVIVLSGFISNELNSSDCTFAGTVSFVSVLLKKAPLLIVVTLEGIVIELRALFANAASFNTFIFLVPATLLEKNLFITLK